MNTAQDRAFAALRIAFGTIWLIDAAFKWNPEFINNFTTYVADAAQGQPAIVQAWINLWVKGLSIDPHFFAILVAVSETAIALGLIFGALTRLAIIGGAAMAFVIWSTAEGFGGPYVAGSTDVGTGIIYVLLFVALWAGKSWRTWSLDAKLKQWLPFLYGAW